MVQSERFLLVKSKAQCWSCRASTEVASIMATTGSILTVYEGPSPTTIDLRAPEFVVDVSEVSPGLKQALASACPTFWPDASLASPYAYWTNHCDLCGVRIGAHALHSHPDGPFFSGPSGFMMSDVPVHLGEGRITGERVYINDDGPMRVSGP